MSNLPTEATFLKDVAEHKMVVVRDDGVHRHIMFRKPGTMCMHFSLITWPGYLCYTGDMGTYVFRRLEDMFEFFRTDRVHSNPRGDTTLSVNPGYWGEKLESVDRCDGYKKFDEDRFNKVVLEYLVTWIKEHRDQTTRDERRELWDSVMNDVIGADGDGGGYRKQVAAHDFHHTVNHKLDFHFQDFWEYNVETYSYRFMWCCYALAWGVKTYDEAKQGETEVAA